MPSEITNTKIFYLMSLKIVVLAKQVPDTRCVGKDAMNADGTINRSALPAIFNPEDLNALEQALRLKDAHPGSTVTMLARAVLPKLSAKVCIEVLTTDICLQTVLLQVQIHWQLLMLLQLPSVKLASMTS